MAAIKRRVLARVTKGEDIEVHLSRATVDGITVLDVRDFVPSTKEYGRGTVLPWTDEAFEALGRVVVAQRVGR